jgi:hypothetical protein
MDDLVDNKENKKYAELINKLINKLNSRSYVLDVIKLSHIKFSESGTIIFNYNSDLLCLQNCVIEKVFGLAITREGKAEDFITKSYNATYNCNFDEDNIDIKFLRNWFKQMFVKSDLILQVYNLLSSCLFGQCGSKNFPFFVGPKNAGKSLFCLLITHMFGYCLSLCNKS